MLRDRPHLSTAVFILISTLLLIFFSWIMMSSLGRSSIFMFSLLLVVANCWYLGMRPGIFLTLISASSVLWFSYSDLLVYPHYVIRAYETLLFIVTGVSVSVVIDKFKRTDLVDEYKRKNVAILKSLQAMECEKNRMEVEVRRRDEFLSIASHELKTPLTTMLLKIQLILHNIRNVSLANFSVEHLMKMLTTAEGQTKRLAKMINDLLNVSLITTGRLDLQKEEADLVQILKEVIEEFSEKLEAGGYKVKLKTDSVVKANVDKLRIEQVLINLVSNAIKYGDGEPIEIIATASSNKAKIVVRDHGVGINEDQKERIFQLFERGIKDTKYRGLGVGLYIANQILRAHHGNIKVNSALNKGSTFIVEIPLNN